ncbi:MAG: translocation/assembly module TamB domain-containing protein [Gemmatimonadota bacterium]
MSAPAPSPSPSTPPPWRALRWVLGLLLALVALFLMTIAATAGWLAGTTSGLNALLALAGRFTPVKIEASGAFGALTREFGFASLRVEVAGTRVEAADLRAQLQQWQWRPLRLDFDHLLAARLRIDVAPKQETSPPLQEIGIPLDLAAARLAIDELTLGLGHQAITVTAIRARVAAGPSGYRFDDAHVAYGAQQADLSLDLGGKRPFALRADALISAALREQAVKLKLAAKGSLADMAVDGQVSGAGSRGTLSARIGSFDTPPVKSLQLDIAGIDPRTWAPSAPHADLALAAQLTPNRAMNEVSGEIRVANRLPGTIDAERLPVRSARARIVANASELKVDQLFAELTQGTAQGEFALQFGPTVAWKTRAQLADVDPASIYAKLQSLRVDGTVRASQSADAISVQADLANRGTPAASLTADVQIKQREATLKAVRLALGSGFVAASGMIGLAADQRIELTGQLQNLQPGLLVKDVDAQLNGTFSASGALQPKPNGSVNFELADSRAWGRPLTARGRVEIDAAQRLEMDVDLAVRSARLRAKGGLGAPDRTLALSLDVPDLGELLPSETKTALTGSLKVSATARGALTAPALEATLNASKLRYGEHAIDTLATRLSYGGGGDGALSVQTQLAGYSMRTQPNIAVRAGTLTVDGKLSQHSIRFEGTTEAAGAARIRAEGGWRQAAWRGQLDEAIIDAPVNLRLAQPANLVVGGMATEVGPARLSLRDVQFDEIRFRADAAGMQTSGRFSDLRPTQWLPPADPALAPVIAPTSMPAPLTLRGQWDLRFGTQVDGSIVIERTSGDLYARRSADSALGLIDVRAEATIKANDLTAIARIESAQRGGIGAQMQASLERAPGGGWRLARQRPWLISGALVLPTMDWINAVLSERIRANVTLGGRLAGTVHIEGTPAEPRASGTLDGDDLRVAWIEQGMRLEKGRLRAHLEDDLIVLDELRFAGTPRTKPDDRRAQEAVKDAGAGVINANGRLRLRDFNGLLQVAATELPLLQRPDRWVVVSGGANIETSATHVQLNGAVKALAGYVDFSRSELPTLSSDVIVVRRQETAEARTPKVTVGFDVGIDLGPAFYVRGSGLEARVEGAVRLRSAGRGVVTAVGSIATVDGVYEGFGQKLKIARGRLNFQGAPGNPGLDVLAVRQGLPVEVGVTITRTAANPLVRLYSDPPLPDAEALSWLVLGRPPDQARGENLALAQAAAGLLGGGGEGYANRVVRSLGFDELSIRSGQSGTTSLLPNRGVAGSLRGDASSSTTVAGEVVTLGKRVSDALSVSYEQAIAGTSRVAQLTYRLSTRLSLVGRVGTDNAIDLVYTFAFD